MLEARSAGALKERLHFQCRGDGDDGMGGTIPGAGEFVTQFTLWAALRPRVGGEEVTAARLSGRQPYVVTVRKSSMMKDVTPAWRIVDKNDPNRILNIVSPPADPDGQRAWLEFLVEEGRPS